MRVYGFCLLTGVACGLTAAGPAAAQSDEALSTLCEGYWNAVLERYPTRATELGDDRFNDRLGDFSDARRQQWKATLRGVLKRLRRLSVRPLSASDRLTHDLLERTIQDELLRMECLGHYAPLEPLNGPHIRFPLILVSQPFRDTADFHAYAARLRGFPGQVTDMIANMRVGIRLGLLSPRILIEKVLPQIRTHIVRETSQSSFYAPLRKADGLSEADRRVVAAEITDAITSDVIPAYLQLLAFVEDEYLPRARLTVGLCDIPNGLKLYNALVYLNTTVRLAPEEIHELGRSEVLRIRGELAKVQAELGFPGALDEFLAHMRVDPRQRFGSREELIAAADAILQRTKPLLPALFARLPKADCVMKEIESFRAASSPVAYYNPPAADGSRPGYYYINTCAPKERLRFTLEALTYHEAVPGHHLQIALHGEDASLPSFRRHGYYSAYGEGWALYAEKLGYEIGGYQDPVQRFGQLTFEMWRACRLVVDTGLHMKGWTRRQAIDFLAAHTSLALRDIEAEVDRYIAWPGQALSYKIGELRILKLRRQAEEQIGDRFDLRAFHDALLSEGSMPIDMLERRMGDWIASAQR